MQAQPAISPKQLDANRRNAVLSTGPRTEEGKAASSRNALRTGLTGRALLLAAEEADAYELHVARYACDFNPATDRESELVQSLADTQWRLNRIPSLEAGFYAMGRIHFADLFAGQPAELQALLIENHTFMTYQRQLSNLSIQESRLRRNYAKDLAELTTLQAKRSEAAKITTAKPAAKSANGFEFSNDPHSLASLPTQAPPRHQTCPIFLLHYPCATLPDRHWGIRFSSLCGNCHD